VQPEDLERIAAGLLNEVPANFSTADLRDVIVELLFGLGVSPSDLPMFCLLLIDKYVADNKIEESRQRKTPAVLWAGFVSFSILRGTNSNVHPLCETLAGV